MIAANSAMYIGIITTCILERCPHAQLLTARVVGALDSGYEITAMVKIGAGEKARSGVQVHVFRDRETQGRSAGDLANSARMAGDEIGAILASVK